jgi:penicillin-binding protein 1C
MFTPRSSRWVATIGAVLGIALASAYWLLALDPSGQPFPERAPATTAIYDRHGVLLYEALDPERGAATSVSLRELPQLLIHATVATEDASFYSNPGVDIVAILRALVQNWRSADVVSGGSTLTQQLVRNLWMTPEERGDRSVWRKLRESAMALRLSARLSKDEILERYLNSAPYGHQAVGVDAAARVYFGKKARDLDLAESALLAGLPQAPTIYDPLLDLPMAQSRQRVVLSLMARQGYITEAEAAAASAEPLRLASIAFPIKAPHFVAYVLQMLDEKVNFNTEVTGGLKVYTTLDLGLQQVAEVAVSRHVAELTGQNVTNGALVAMDPNSGEILAMVGSAGYFEPSIDGQVNVTTSLRQPGSSIKPVLYAAALEQGITPATVLYDVPTSFLTADGKSYAPENYDRTWHGPVSVRDALANSYNLPAVRLMQQVGLSAFLDMAARMGLTSLATRGAGDLGLALGSGEVRPLELAEAYAALAAGGVAHEPEAIGRVEDAGSRLLWQAGTLNDRQVTSPQIAYLLTSILSDNDARSPSFGDGSPLRLSRPAAAKTGTTTDWRDNWTAGYTPDLAAVVWVGNADNSPMTGVSGISGAAPIWHDFMEEALKGRPAREFQEPSGLVRREVCADSGELPSTWCPNRRVELFLPGTVPTQVCSWHQSFVVDRSTGRPPGPDTPPDLIEQQVFEVVPPELQQWARDRGIPRPPVGLSPSDEQTVRLPPGPLLVLTSPANGTVFQISQDLPLTLQKIEVSAAVAGVAAAARVELRADGTTLASFDGPPYGTVWQLIPGSHRFEAVAMDPDGKTLASDVADVTVEQPNPHPQPFALPERLDSSPASSR